MLILQPSGWRVINSMVVGPWSGDSIYTVGASLLVVVKGAGPITAIPPGLDLAIQRNLVPTDIEIWYTYQPAHPAQNFSVSGTRAIVLALVGHGGPRSGTDNFIGQAAATGNVNPTTTSMTIAAGVTPPRLPNALMVSAVSRVVNTTEVTLPNYNVVVQWGGGFINTTPEISLLGVAGDADRTGMSVVIWWRTGAASWIEAGWSWSEGAATAIAGAQFPLP